MASAVSAARVPWRLLRSGPGEPAWNMAVDEVDLETALRTHPMYVRKSDKIANFGGIHQKAANAQHAGHTH